MIYKAPKSQKESGHNYLTAPHVHEQLLLTSTHTCITPHYTCRKSFNA